MTAGPYFAKKVGEMWEIHSDLGATGRSYYREETAKIDVSAVNEFNKVSSNTAGWYKFVLLQEVVAIYRQRGVLL